MTVIRLGGLVALGAMAVMGACCVALLRDVPDELPDTPGDRRPLA